MIEVKTTESKQYIVKHKDMSVLHKRAASQGKQGVLIIEFEDGLKLTAYITKEAPW